MLLAGGDLIQSFAIPNLWKEADVCSDTHRLGPGMSAKLKLSITVKSHCGRLWMFDYRTDGSRCS